MEKMYIKFEEDGTYGFYTPSIHGEEILEDESYLKISQELYNEAMEFSGIKILTPELILVDSPIEKEEEKNAPKPKTEVEMLKERLEATELALIELMME